ncbi:AMP-binding enzyme domain-containing protein [Trichoderma breve]|uniref:AMP-binding enzyme domain-containing protein n=1 Tax=Trichoderma breve TaxID=2034170 RepID=A0A9W9JQ74_9HYPO|nr:AMP-binding enzyme domain-containing protein [Trichoderma breve]KAJ4863535.1 AMP-binding enzyme domain-containing protein [Trichoderma breve]
MVICFLGVLKTGALYVPVDVESWSKDRIQSTLKRVSARVVLNTSTEEYPGYEEISLKEIESAFTPTIERHWDNELDRPWKRIDPSDLAFIIFTSGTTSTPKGVMIPHSSVLNYVQQGGEITPFNLSSSPADIVILIFSPAFDACTAVTVSALCNGAELKIATPADFLYTATLCTIMACTPSVLATIQDPASYSNLRAIMIGGEAAPASLVRKWAASLPTSPIYNFYGPTETTFACLVSRLYPDKPITLGRPMSNSRVMLLDGQAESHYGEICIAGPGLARGYYENELLTADKFVYWQGERIYRTGDFARWTDHGLEFAGRKDNIVKNRGFLVSLDGQVIPMLCSHPKVMAATAFMHQGRLVAFVTPEDIDGVALRKILTEKYDSFIIPDIIRPVEILPLTANDKIDNRALQALLSGDNLVHDVSSHGSKMDILKAALSFAISLPPSEIPDNSSFAELGGNSLAGLKVLSFLRTKGFHMRLGPLFDLPNLSTIHDAMAKFVGTEEEDGTSDQKPTLASGPMTSLQTKMIRTGIRNPATSYMLLRMTLPYSGNAFSGETLQSAWQQVIERHSIFRTAFNLKDQTQHVQQKLHLDWKNEETTRDQLERVIRIRSQEMRKRISYLGDGDTFIPISAYRLIIVPNVASTFLALVHHSLVDGWSFSIILEELRLALDGKPLSEPPQFINIALAQKRLQQDPQGNEFWEKCLKDGLAQPKLRLPKPSVDVPVADWSKSLQVNLGFGSKELEAKSRLRRITPATAIYTAWGLVLSNYSFSDRVAFGVVFSGRNIDAAGADRVVGPLLNTCPFPLEFKESQSVADILSDAQSQLLQMLEFQWCADNALAKMPSERIANAFQTIVVVEYDLPSQSGSCEAIPKPWKIEREDMMEFGITLLLEDESDGSLRARILYDGSLYTEQSVVGLLNHFKRVIEGLLDCSNSQMQQVRNRIILEEEKKTLLSPSKQERGRDYQGYDTVKDAFEAAAAKWPDLTALESTCGSMTYRELDESANKLASHLRSITNPGDVVGILTDGSLHWVVAILSALKAGCICCPIDVSLPAARIEVIIQQSGATIFIAANKDCARVIQALQGSRIIVSDEFLASCKTPSSSPGTVSKPKDVIYLVFTSGSTGIPKGVALHNRSILMVIDDEVNRMFSRPGRRHAQVYALGFDVVLVELFGSICYGGTLVLKDPSDPLGHLKRVDATYSTPSLLAALSPEEFSNVETIGLAGEPVPQSLADRWSHKRLFNFYGPSECGPISTRTELRPGEQVTIGKVVPHLDIYLLDHHQCLVPIGVTGEIYISGEQITDGYWNLQTETLNAFVPNPFSLGKVMYKTGDLGYWTQDMKVAYVGRIDNQVKLRGYRIEMEEVESALMRADSSIQSAVAIVVDRVRLVAFVTPSTVDVLSAGRMVKKFLPAYACPAQVIAIESLPQSSNLKIDRKALRELATENLDQGDAPSTPTEKLIAEIWRKVLDFQGHNNERKISRDDDFLAIGGNSLLAIKAARLIAERTGHHTPVPLLIRETVLSNLAKEIDRFAALDELEDGITTFKSFLSTLSAPPSIMAAQIPSQLEEEFYLWHIMSNTKSLFNTAFQFIIKENPILRARYVLKEGFIYRLVSDKVTPPLVFSGRSIGSKDLQALIDKPFDLAHDQLIRAVICAEKDEHATTKTSLSLITHHIVTDKASLALLLQSISQKYLAAADAAVCNGQAVDENTHKGTYLEWTQWLQKNSSLPATPTKLAKREFWNDRVRRIETIPLLSKHELGRPGHEIPGYESIIISTTDGKGFSQRMALAASAITLYTVFGYSDIVLGIPYMNRDEPGAANIMGLLLDRLPLRIKLDDNNMVDSSKLINDIVSEINLSVENQMPYSEILQLAKDRRSLFDVVVIYHWQSDALEHSLKIPGAQVSSERIRTRGAKFTLQLEFSEQDDGLHCGIEYNAGVLSPPQMAAIMSFIPTVFKGLLSGSAPAEILFSFRLLNDYDPLEAMPSYHKRVNEVRKAFSEALGIQTEGITPETTLYDLGGTSITALRLHYLLGENGLRGDLCDILRAPSLGEIAWMFQ